MDTTRTVTFSIQLNTSAIERDAPLDIWQGILGLDEDTEWMDVYNAMAMAHLAGGDYHDYVLRQRNDITDDQE